MKTFIIGHQKPDTDAVVASIALEYLYNNLTDEYSDYQNPTSTISDSLNPETSYIFNKYNIPTPALISAADIAPKDKVILVDHNEVSQQLEGINQDQIVNIIDHHKANISLNSPICLIFRPWGSTSTIIYHVMKMKNVAPSKEIATLMLCAILSDTVGFKSSTTTQKDQDLAIELAKIAEIDDLEALTLEIFKAKSDVSKLSIEQIVKNDYKIFDFSQKTFIDQLETVEQAEILSSKKQELLAAMHTVKTELSVELLFVAITDILKVNTKLLILSDAEAVVAIKAFGGQVIDQVLDIGPKLSRKKDIAPPIQKALES